MDTQREEFQGRIARLAGSGAQGAGTGTGARAAPGTGGGRVRPVALILVALLATKAVVHARIGAESYDHRIALLASGDRADRIGASILAPDPVTRVLSGMLRALSD